jgi:thiol-disulfide isomerase/thioredoxin
MKTASIKLFILRAIMILSGGFFLYAAILEVSASSHNNGAQSTSAQSAPITYTDTVDQSTKVLPRNKNAATSSTRTGSPQAKTLPAPRVDNSKDPLRNVQSILVHLDATGQLSPYHFPHDGENIEYVVFYLASGGCSRCKAFSPRLVQTYNNLKRENNNFEIVLVDYDRSEVDMVNYMRRESMRFPAVQYDLRKQAAITNMYQGITIPILVIMDRKGNVRYTNANNALRTADDVLTDLARLVK